MRVQIYFLIKILYATADTDLHISTPRLKAACRSAYDDTLIPKASQRAIPSSKSREYCVHKIRTETEEKVHDIFVKNTTCLCLTPFEVWRHIKSNILRFLVKKALTLKLVEGH